MAKRGRPVGSGIKATIQASDVPEEIKNQIIQEYENQKEFEEIKGFGSMMLAFGCDPENVSNFLMGMWFMNRSLGVMDQLAAGIQKLNNSKTIGGEK